MRVFPAQSAKELEQKECHQNQDDGDSGAGVFHQLEEAPVSLLVLGNVHYAPKFNLRGMLGHESQSLFAKVPLYSKPQAAGNDGLRSRQA
jgi:hypothetical protein